jgi:hypothetical protein
MRKKQANATTIRLEQADREAIAQIREFYGCPSDAAAIKLAVRMVARGEGVPAQAQIRNAAFIPMDQSQGLSVAEIGKRDN